MFVNVAVAVCLALVLWWLGTVAVMYLDGLPEGTFRWSMLGASALLALALCGMAACGPQLTVAAAMFSFTCGVLAWGWQEMAFLTGLLTGPRRRGCVPGCSGARHFLHAVQTLLWHELGIVGGALAVLAVSHEQPNRLGAETYLLLWALRQSAKLNLYFGVANPGEEFLPPHLRYLHSYFGKRRVNLLFPVSVSAATALAAWRVADAFGPSTTPFGIARDALLATLATLGALEHWLLVLPVRASALWKWGLRSHRRNRALPERARESTHAAGAPGVVRSL